MTKLPDVKGRIYYISSHARQENLYAVYETTERKFWSELAKCNQEEFAKSGTDGKCIEARELIIALPEELVEYDPNALLKLFTEHFKQNYGTECIAALHHNKRKTNYHIHLILSERKLLDEAIEKVATRNMFYDEAGKHVRTKKEILDENGQIREGCKVVLKGQVYERKQFTIKDSRFKREDFLDEVKRSYTDLINLYVKDENDHLKVFERGGVYLPMKKIGKNNPKAELIKADNEVRTRWNMTVDNALVNGVSEKQVMAVKRTQISEKAKESFKQNGRNPALFSRVIELAITTLELFIRNVIDKVKHKETPMPQEPVKIPEVKPAVEKHVPERPKMSKLASEYEKLAHLHWELKGQTALVNSKKDSIEELKRELTNTKGLFKGKERKAIQERIELYKEDLVSLEKGIPAIVKKHQFKSVKEFMAKLSASEKAYKEYRVALQEYEKETGSKPELQQKKESITGKLERIKQENKRREIQRQRPRKKSWDRDER